MQVFWVKGYAATSVEDLVDALHLSRSSLYDTFGDKRTLFLDALRLYSKGALGRIARTLSESLSPITGIETLFDELVAGVGTESGDQGCFMVNSVAELVPYDADVTEIATAYANTFQQLLTEALTLAAAQGVVTRTRTPDQLAAYLFNAIQGMRIIIKSGATREQVQAVGAITLESLR